VLKKVLIANRGEIAVRIIRACHEMKIPTVAVYSQADADALHVRLAEEAVCIGPPPSRDSYLNMPNIISAAVITGADAIHPGFGYFSEQASFAEACEACNLTFIGPKPAVIEKMGDKARARDIMKSANVPVIPGSDGPVESEQQALKCASKLGYPVMIKAVAGGGGRGIRLVQNEEELVKDMKTSQTEAEAAFGDGRIYLEKYIEDPRHIEIQILADSHGHQIHLGERECSIQNSRHQKILEEAPSIAVNTALRQKMGEAAVRAAKAVGYSNAGTVEFLLDKSGSFYFMEMNTRVQVEHPVTEAVTGVDIVREQIRIAAGEKLSLTQKDVRIHGHAIECRINADDPEDGYKPSAGKITNLQIPGGLGVRLDTHLYAGYEVPPYYDALLAKLITWGSDRNEAINRMSRCLNEFEIEGIKTNINFHKKILGNAYYRRGEISLSFIRRRISNSGA
jgi:acetyl-CoA carboxylase, biotin carboxylase subunit